MEPIKRTAKYYYYRFVRLRTSPEEMARGLAIGVFVGFTPTFGIQSILSIFIAAIFRGNKFLAAGAAFVTNPITIPFIYGGTYLTGAAVLQNPVDSSFLAEPSLEGLWSAGGDIFAALWVGGIIVGLAVAVVVYFLVLSFGPKAQLKFAGAKAQNKR